MNPSRWEFELVDLSRPISERTAIGLFGDIGNPDYSRIEIDYLAECWLDDELVIATWVRDFHKVRSWRDYVIVRPRDSAVICRAATLWVLVDLATRRPCRVDREMVKRFDPLQVHEDRKRSPCR